MASLNLYARFNRFLETYAPHGLYGRTLAIMITPVVLLQISMAGIIFERYWDNVTKVLARSLSNEIGLLITLYETSDKSDAALKNIELLAHQKLRMNFTYERNGELPAPLPSPWFSLFDAKIRHYLSLESDRQYWVNSAAPNGQVEIRVRVTSGLIFFTSVKADRAHAVGTPLMLAFMILSTISLLAIAVIFMRNQIRPILDLTKAAKAFGMGREIGKFIPRGATEVRQAGEAFVDMKRRIARHVEQRTTMLAGVSHDLRTILTRFKLELAVMGDNSKTKPLRDDVIEMQHMLEDYLAFARGDEGELALQLKISDLVQSSLQGIARGTDSLVVKKLPENLISVKPISFRRMFGNIIGNALRYGTVVEVSGNIRDDRLWLYVDDNGPGIPPHLREDVFRPFVRLDAARNLDKSGTGLGLAIALDIAQAHGGDIYLEDSALGGLRVVIKIPV
jgi:two-component system, OmpR family, osmolarity sensor histidine kinase EnvZ